MTRIPPWLLLPVAMVTFVFLAECMVNGVDLSIERVGDCVKVRATNNTYRCAMFQWNSEPSTNGWHDYHGYLAGTGETPCRQISFDVKADNQRAFWRLRDCANP